MIDELRAIAIFAETIRQGSFRGAAKSLALSASVVSYHITQLEERVGTALIYRSTRKLSLTHEGEILYQHANDMLSSAQQGLSKVTSTGTEATGKLTVTLPAALTRAPITREIAQFSRLNPGVELHIGYTDERQDIIATGIDLAISAGHLPDSSLKSKRIGEVERKLVCSPEYWSQQKKPTRPKDLASWNWIKLEMLPNYRILLKPGRKPVQINFTSHVYVDSVEAMTQLCVCGLGLATPPNYLVDEALASGKLIEVLPEWCVEPIPVYALWPRNVSDSSNTRRLLDYLTGSGQTKD